MADEYLHHCGAPVPGFLLSLDFFNVNERISIQWLYYVLKTMDFSAILCH
jgi:hypothetical protein